MRARTNTVVASLSAVNLGVSAPRRPPTSPTPLYRTLARTHSPPSQSNEAFPTLIQQHEEERRRRRSSFSFFGSEKEGWKYACLASSPMPPFPFPFPFAGRRLILLLVPLRYPLSLPPETEPGPPSRIFPNQVLVFSYLPMSSFVFAILFDAHIFLC